MGMALSEVGVVYLMKEKVKWLFSRKLSDPSALKEDLRKLGLVLMGGGVIGMIMNRNHWGFVLILAGAIAWFFGLTEMRGSDHKNHSCHHDE
jgi:hypothetical protein